MCDARNAKPKVRCLGCTFKRTWTLRSKTTGVQHTGRETWVATCTMESQQGAQPSPTRWNKHAPISQHACMFWSTNELISGDNRPHNITNLIEVIHMSHWMSWIFKLNSGRGKHVTMATSRHDSFEDSATLTNGHAGY